MKYKKNLQNDPEFRQYFNELCAKIGVDPLVSNKGFWGELLGVGDFYYELGIQIVEICMKSRNLNGGLMDLDDALTAVRKRRGTRGQQVSRDDIEKAVKQLKALGEGFQIIRVGAKKMLQSVPYQLSNDHTTVLQLAQSTYFVSLEAVVDELHWSSSRCELVLNELLEEGMAWIDVDPVTHRTLYWFPTLFFGSTSSPDANAEVPTSSSPVASSSNQ